jgi:protein-S-isoprenylcysteine O-methyltransferase Ste14
VTTPTSAGASGAGLLERVGAWVFRQRSWTPVPLALILLAVNWHRLHAAWLFGLGVLVVLTGLGVRYWGVSHIGTISRTRAARLGPLMTAGPYALVRNPLYVGNFLIWTGFVLASGLLWMLPVAWIVFALQYSAIARFEEAALIRHFGEAYHAYARVVPRWLPNLARLSTARRTSGAHGWREVCFSERGTLIAAGAMTTLLLARFLWLG